ncbi:nucleoprotein [Dirofilaria immitis]
MKEQKKSTHLLPFLLQMSNSAATRPTTGGTGIRSFFSKLRKPSDLQIPPAQIFSRRAHCKKLKNSGFSDGFSA